jgi:hypothetical protein
MTSRRLPSLVSLGCFLALGALLWGAAAPAPAAGAEEGVRARTYRRLDQMRHEKKRQLEVYLEKIRQRAQTLQNDPLMLSFFKLQLEYSRLLARRRPPEDVSRKVALLAQKINEHYLRQYLCFYDILFIASDGAIFHTIRGEADYRRNLFAGRMAKTPLARQLRSRPSQTFVDYHYYWISDEPSAFYVVPALDRGELRGWFALQCAITKINNIFTKDARLGSTGEAFLVNRDQYMLTQSRFSGETSILKQHLSAENIRGKFAEGSGHKVVVDYRGQRALSSFEVCDLGQSQWLLIVKIDEDEVITQEYQRRRPSLGPELLERLAGAGPSCAPPDGRGKVVKVDMDEFRKVRAGGKLVTYGVSTCTAAAVTYPGRFSYLCHASNLDRLYGGETTDLLGRMLQRIQTFDIYPYEKRKLSAAIIAARPQAVLNAVDLLVKKGLFLSQIKVLLNPAASRGAPLHQCDTGRTVVRWTGPGQKRRYQCSQDAATVASRFSNLIGYPGGEQ